jgi:Flp pilus assembly protein protease CpaA
MSAIAHVPGAAWASAHRALLLIIAVSVVTVAVTLAVLLTTRTPTSGSTPVPELPRSEDVCPGWTPGYLC